MQDQCRLSYANKVILAPMVRVGTLPMRLLSLDYGADIVYTEEIIDWKFLRSVRRVNDVLGTIDFVDSSDGTVVFRTCQREKHRVVVQLGTCDPDRALHVLQLIENDVAGVDVNMGCPKEFSLKGGMGSALLTQPDKAKSILQTLVAHAKVPITCKIRVFESIDDTLNLVKLLESTGIAAIGIHGRTKQERPRHQNRNDTIKYIAENIRIPVVANGGSRDISQYSDIAKFRANCGSSSVMIARSAQGNCSIFNPNGMSDLETVIVKYLHYCIEYDNAAHNTKYCVQNMLKELQETPRGKRFLECQTLEQICSIWDLGDLCHKKQVDFQKRGLISRREIVPEMFKPPVKRTCHEHDEQFSGLQLEMPLAFVRSSYARDPDLPKSRLLMWSIREGHAVPSYQTVNKDKLFRAIVTVAEKRYSSSFWEKNKRFAEQGAALVSLKAIGLVDMDQLIKDGSIL